MIINVLSLFVAETAEKILARGLELAAHIGLPVSSWRSGDPTRSLYQYLATVISSLEEQNVEFAKSGFLSTAEGDWLTLLAQETYGVARGEATFATPTATLTNGGGGVFELAAGDLILKCTATGKTYRSTNAPGSLGPGVTLTYELIAEESGSASSAGVDEIDDFVTPAEMRTFGVTIDSSTAAAAQDQQSAEELRDQCGDTLGALSPDGPPDAYEYVAKNSELTGVTEVNRATTAPDDETGLVTLYIASASGAVSSPSVDAVQAAVLRWATPLCIRPTTVSAAAISVSVTAVLTGEDIPSTFADDITGALERLMISLPIGGTVYRSRIISEIHKAVPAAVSVNLIEPAEDTEIDPEEVPALGVVSVTEA